MKATLKSPLFSVAAVSLLLLLFCFTLYYLSHDTSIIGNRSIADILLMSDEE